MKFTVFIAALCYLGAYCDATSPTTPPKTTDPTTTPKATDPVTPPKDTTPKPDRTFIGTTVTELNKALSDAVSDITKHAYNSVLVLGYDEKEKASTDVKDALSAASYKIHKIDTGKLLVASKNSMHPIADGTILVDDEYEKAHCVYEYATGQMTEDGRDMNKAFDDIHKKTVEALKKTKPADKPPKYQGVTLFGSDSNFRMYSCIEQPTSLARNEVIAGGKVKIALATLPAVQESADKTKNEGEGSFFGTYQIHLLVVSVILGLLAIGGGVYYYMMRRRSARTL